MPEPISDGAPLTESSNALACGSRYRTVQDDRQELDNTAACCQAKHRHDRDAKVVFPLKNVKYKVLSLARGASQGAARHSWLLAFMS